jgi:hypothetical protein
VINELTRIIGEIWDHRERRRKNEGRSRRSRRRRRGGGGGGGVVLDDERGEPLKRGRREKAREERG